MLYARRVYNGLAGKEVSAMTDGIAYQHMDIIYHKPAAKALDRLDAPAGKRIRAAIGNIPMGDIKPLAGKYPLLRLRVGDWRVLFYYDGGTVIIAEIAPRGDIYKGTRK
jgi:mRNA interferase RelE/StbE